MSDLISRADAIDCTDFLLWLLEEIMDEENWHWNAEADGEIIARKLTKLGLLEVKDGYYVRTPSAVAETTVIRSRTLMPTKDFKEWAKRIKEVNPNAVVIPCDAEVVSAEAVQRWIPCSEGLPEAEYGESDCVFATCCWKSDTQKRWIEKLYFNGGNWCHPTGECFTQKVLAWTPMIEPYREDGEE